jgi:hypothetical protein
MSLKLAPASVPAKSGAALCPVGSVGALLKIGAGEI